MLVLVQEEFELSDIDYSDLIGIPYKLNGTDKNGMDCFGLVREMLSRAGVVVPSFDYADDSDSTIMKMILDNVQFAEEIEEPEPYCVVLIRQIKYGRHMGVVLPDKVRFIHCCQGKGVSVERIDTPLRKSRVMGYYKWTGHK